MNRKKRRMPPIEDVCLGTRIHRLRVHEEEDLEEELNVDRCVKCRKWFFLNANGECDECLKTSDQVVQSGSESC